MSDHPSKEAYEAALEYVRRLDERGTSLTETTTELALLIESAIEGDVAEVAVDAVNDLKIAIAHLKCVKRDLPRIHGTAIDLNLTWAEQAVDRAIRSLTSKKEGEQK